MDPHTDEYWARCRTGDLTARAELIELYRPLATAAARRFRISADALDSPEDREAAGTIGLIQAIDRFNPERGVPFEAFARARIRGAIIDEMRRLNERSRTRQTANEDETQQRTISLDELAEHGDRRDVADSNDVEERIAFEGLRTEISVALSMIAPRDRTILAAYYSEGLTLAAIGMRFGFSEARACQIHGKAIRQLRSLMGVAVPASFVTAA